MSVASIGREWEFEEELPRRKTRHDNVKNDTKAKKGTKKEREVKIHLPATYTLRVIKTYITRKKLTAYQGVCPSEQCGHKTVGCLNYTGARATLQAHIKGKH